MVVAVVKQAASYPVVVGPEVYEGKVEAVYELVFELNINSNDQTQIWDFYWECCIYPYYYYAGLSNKKLKP